MKSFLEKSKRALVLLLTGAMIATSVPSNAFAATVADTDDVIIEEVTDAVATDAVEEEIATPDAVVEDAADTFVENESENDSVESDAGDYDRTLTIGNSTGTVAGDSAGQLGNLYVGKTMTNAVYKLTYTTPTNSTPRSYTDVTWALMKRKGAARSTTPGAADAYTDDKLESAVSELEGLGLHIGFEGDTAIISGAPVKAAVKNEFVLVATDNDNTNNRTYKPILLGVGEAGARITIDTAATDARYTAATMSAPATIAFGNLKMNFVVADAKPADVSDNEKWVKPFKLEIDGTNIDEAGAIGDFVYPVTKVEDDLSDANLTTDEFVVTAEPSSLYNSHNIILTITPGTGLAAASNADTSITRWMYIKSAALSNDNTISDYIKVKITITMKDDLAITVKQGTKEIAVTPDTATTGHVTVGNAVVGKTIDDIVFTAKGGFGELTLTSDYATAAGKKVNGLVLNKSDQTAGTATYTLTGTVEPTAIGNKTVVINVADKKGNTYALTVTIPVMDADVEVWASTANGGNEKLASGATTYNWYAPSDYTEADKNNYKATFTIKNKSTQDIEITPTYTAGTATFLPSTASKFTVPKNGEYKYEVTPGAAAGNSTVTFAGDGITTYTVTLNFNKESAVLNVTKPAALVNAKLGQPYSITCEATKDSTLGPVEWHIVTGTDGTTASILENTYGLTINRTTGEISGTPKTLSAGINVKVEATSYQGTTHKSAAKEYTLVIEEPTATEAFSLTSGSKLAVKEPYSVVDIPSLKKDSTETSSATIEVKNLTAAKLEHLKAKIEQVVEYKDGAEGSTPLANPERYFTIVYDDNDTINTAETTAGFELAASTGSKNIKVKTGVPSSTEELKAGTYVATVTVGATSNPHGSVNVSGSYTFKVKFTVEDAPVITTSANLNTLMGTANQFVLGTTYVATAAGTNLQFIPALASDKDMQFDVTWADADDADPDHLIAASGLKLDKGFIGGEAKKAGNYSVIVTASNKATGNTAAGTYVGHLKFKFKISSNKKFFEVATTATVGGADLAINANDQLVLDGAVVGDAPANRSLITFHVDDGTGTQPIIAKGIKVMVEDAPEDRTAAEIAKSSVKTNRFVGSKEYISVSDATDNIATIGDITDISTTASQSRSFYIKAAKTTQSGTYKVKITLYADDVTPYSFYATMIVTDKLAITKPAEATAKVGEKSLISLSATGPKTAQLVTWTEEGTEKTPGGAKESYVGGGVGTPVNTGFILYNNGAAANATSNDGLHTAIGDGTGMDIATDEAAPIKAGTFTVNLKAAAAAKPLPAYDPETAPEGIVGAAAGTTKNNGTNAIKAQDAKESISITISKTDKLSISELGSTDGDNSTNVTKDEDKARYEGSPLGTGFIDLTGYEFKHVIKGTTPATATLTVKNDSKSNVTSNVALEAGANSKFTLGAATVAPTAGNTATITVTPKSNLDVGTYTDNVVFSGDNNETFKFKVTYVVESKTYLVSVGYEWNKDKTPKWELYKDAIVEKNGTAKAKVSLKSVKKSATNTPDGTVTNIVLTNAGNSNLENLVIEEVNASGVAIGEGSSDAKLKITTGTPVADWTPGSGENFNAVTGVTTTLEAGTQRNFQVAVISLKQAGDFEAYIGVSYKDPGATGGRTKVIVPVKYTVLDTGLTNLATSITGSSLVLTQQNEGYDPDEAKQEVTIRNSATSGGQNTLVNVKATVTGSDFVLVKNDTNAKQTNATTITLDALPANGQSSFFIKPVKGLAVKNAHEATLIISADNLQKSESFAVSFAVAESPNFNYEVRTTDTPINDYANRLWNTVVNGLKVSDDHVVKVTSDAVGSSNLSSLTANTETDVYVWMALDGQDNATGKKDDVVIKFNVKNASGTTLTGAVATTASIKISGGNSVKAADQSITLTAAQKKAASESVAHGYVAATSSAPAKYAKYFDEIKLRFLAKATYDFVTSGYTGVESADELVNDYVTVQTNSGTKKVEKVFAYVPAGSALSSVLNGQKLPTGTKTGETFGGWVLNSNKDVSVTANTPIYEDTVYVPGKHNHSWPAASDKNEAHVKWVWTGDAATGYTDAELHLYCTEANCPAEDKGEIIIYTNGTKNVNYDKTGTTKVVITRSGKDADCAHGARLEYEAKVTVNGIEYSSKKPTSEGTPLGHKYGDAVITWTQDATTGVWSAKVTKTCSVCNGDMDGHTIELTATVTEDKTTYAPKCTEAGKYVYTLVSYVDEKGNTVTDIPADKKTKETNKPAKGHNAEPIFDFSNVDLDKLTAAVVVTCPDDNFELYNGPATLKQEADGTYACKVTGKDGKEYTGIYTPHVHEWTATWAEWKRTDVSDNFSWSTSLTLTCNKGPKPEVRTPEVKIEKKNDDKYIDYIATAIFDKQTFTSEPFTVDALTGEPTSKHEHKWSAPAWKWTSSTDASATFTCTVGNEEKSVPATITFVKENSKGNKAYKASVTGPDGKPYESALQWFDPSGNPTSGEGIGIEGLEDEYFYTGGAITPAFTVVDYSIDKVLAPGTDYSFKWTNNNPNPKRAPLPQKATLTVTGKGNYGVKDGIVTAEIMIVDPLASEDTSDYVSGIKSVKASKDGYTYDGTAKYPKTLTIKTQSDGDVTATLNSSGDGYDLPDGFTKNMMIVVENNVNKGNGTVAVTGADKVTKKTTFPIKAASLKDAGTDLTITPEEAVWAVKGAKPELAVEYKGLDLVEGKDFTVSLKDNKKVGTGQVTITGKNNFTGKSAAVSFAVTPFEITKVDNVAVYAGVAGKGVKVTMYDAQGNVIPAKANYTVKVEKGETDITADKTKLQAKDEIKVTVTAATGGNLTPESTADVDITVAPNLAKIKVNVPKTYTKTYTGEAIELDADDFGSGKITVGTLEYGTDFEIVGYQNNVKKGTMTAYIQGISENASGIGKVKVKIVAQQMKKAD